MVKKDNNFGECYFPFFHLLSPTGIRRIVYKRISIFWYSGRDIRLKDNHFKCVYHLILVFLGCKVRADGATQQSSLYVLFGLYPIALILNTSKVDSFIYLIFFSYFSTAMFPGGIIPPFQRWAKKG